MANSWNTQHFQPNQQPTNQIRFFDPSQFQAPATSIANPAAGLKTNQHQDVTAGQSNSQTGNAQIPDQQHPQAQYQGNAWGGAPTSNSGADGTMQEAHNAWSSWGNWDWNQDQNNAVNAQPQHQQYQPQQPYQQQPPPTSQAGQQTPYQQQPPTSQAAQQQPPTSQAGQQMPYQQQPPTSGEGDIYAGASQQQYNPSWDTSGHYAQPNHQNFPAVGNVQGQDMQYNQPHGASYFGGGDPNAYGNQNQFFDNQPQTEQQQQHQFPDESGMAVNQTGEGAGANTQAVDHHQTTAVQQQPNSSSSLDQGQSQVLYDQPSSLPQNEYNPMSSFSDNGPWLDNSHQQQPHFHNQLQQPSQHDGMAGHGFAGTEEAGGEENIMGQGHQHHHSHDPSLVASNASPNVHQHPDSFQSIPLIAAPTTPSPSHHPHHQSPEAVSADVSLNEYCDNDSDGGTVAGFFGRGDDDGDVSSDAQRSSNRSSSILNSSLNTTEGSTTLNTSGGSESATASGTSGQDSGMFLNVASGGKPIARENSEISNASLSTFNMSVDDAGMEYLHDLQALVQRMENVDISNRQAAQAEAEQGGNQQDGLVTANPPSSLELDQRQQHHHHQQKRGDYSGFGNDPQLHNNPPLQPPPTLNLDTNPVADRPTSPDGGIAASSESGGSGASGTSSGLTDWEIVPSQTQMTHSRNSSLDNNVTAFTDKPDGSISESVRDGSSNNNKDGGMDDNLSQSQSQSSSSSQQQQSFNPSYTVKENVAGSNFQNAPFSAHPSSQNSENLPVENVSLSSPPTAALATATNTALSAAPQQQSPEGPLSFQPSKITKLASSSSSHGGSNIPLPPPPTSTNAAAYFNPPPPVSNSNPSSIPPVKLVANIPSPSTEPTSHHKAKSSSILQPPLPAFSDRPKLPSEDGTGPAISNRKSDSEERAPAPASSSYSSNSEQKFRKPQDPGMRRAGDNPGDKAKASSSASSSSQRRHPSAFHPIHRPRQNTVSPATTLWDTDSGSSSNILLAPAMPLIIPALNPYSSSAAATATKDTAPVSAPSSTSVKDNPKPSSSTSTAARGRVSSKEVEDQTPRSRYGDRKGDRERGREDRPHRDREDANRSFDSLDELDSGPDYRTPRDKPYKSERPESRSDRRYEYDYPSARSDRPMSRTEGGYRDDPQYRRTRGYYADTYYDEHYDRPRSRHDEAARANSRPSSRSGGQEVDRPGSRGGEYDRERDYGYKDRNRGHYYDGYGRNDYYNDDRDRYYGYHRDRDARYSRGYYEEYYGKDADQYLQQHQQQQQQQQQQQRQARPGSRSHESDGAGSRNHSRSRSQSRGNTPGPEQQSDYYNRSSRPHSRQDYARDYYRGYGGYDYAQYYNAYGYDPYAGYGYAGYPDTATNQGYDQGRMTPPKYSYPHVRACFGPNGQLIKVLPNRPADGQPAVVELMEVQTVLETCQEAEDLKQFPGPLTREGTHKKDVLLFCQRKAVECMEDVDMVDRESAQLIWKLLELLIKQNGSVVGTDLSDLLLEGHEPGAMQYSTAGRRASSRQSTDGLELMTEDSLEGDGSSRNSPAMVAGGGVRTAVGMDRTVITPNHQREDYIARFRHLLLYGRKKDAIECAMKYNLWGHALFLASKVDTRTHASVMIRFANSAMRMNDPLQTLYQLMSGRQPASVTCVVDERWGDWRPHLAMILSNQTSRPDLDRKSITTLGDTLAAKGCLHASHFCYLMAQVPFGTFDKKTSKIVLVAANHYLPLKEFASMEAIQCTEVYEYSQTLSNAVFCLPHFQLYKYLYACRLVDFGLVTEAFMYCEVMASAICRYPSYFQPSFVHLVFELASKLKYSDPQRQNSHVDEHVDPVWIEQLQGLLPQYADGTIQPVSGSITPADLRSSADGNSGGDGMMYQQQYTQQQQQQQQPQQSNVTDAASGYYQGSGEVPAQESSSAGFDTQGVYQYSQPTGQADYGTGQYYQQDGSVTDQQAQQSYPGYDQTDAATSSAAAQQQDQQSHQDYSATDAASAAHQASYDHQTAQQQQQQQHDYNQWQQQQYNNQTDLTSSQASSGFSGASGFGGHTGSGSMAMPPRASISTNETEDDDDDDEDNDDDDEQGGTVTGFDYFGNAGQRVVVPPNRFRTPSESSATGGRRRRTTSEGSTGSVKASPHKPSQAQPSSNASGSLGAGGDVKGGSAGGGWLGGLFSKFGRNKKNEMILPDDKDPAIVWDHQKKKWMNADGTEEEVSVAAPPPKDTDLMGAPPPSMPMASTGMPPPSTAPPGTNKFSLKAKGVRNQYVDVNNPKPVAAPQGLFNVTPTMGNGAPSGSVPQVFLPGSTPTAASTGNDTNNSSSNNLLNVPATGDETTQDTTMQQSQPPPAQTAAPAATAPPPPSSTATNAMPMLFNPATLNAGGNTGSTRAGPGLKYGQRRAYPKK